MPAQEPPQVSIGPLHTGGDPGTQQKCSGKGQERCERIVEAALEQLRAHT